DGAAAGQPAGGPGLLGRRRRLRQQPPGGAGRAAGPPAGGPAEEAPRRGPGAPRAEPVPAAGAGTAAPPVRRGAVPQPRVRGALLRQRDQLRGRLGAAAQLGAAAASGQALGPSETPHQCRPCPLPATTCGVDARSCLFGGQGVSPPSRRRASASAPWTTTSSPRAAGTMS